MQDYINKIANFTRDGRDAFYVEKLPTLWRAVESLLKQFPEE